MAFVIADRVRETSTTTGTGNFTLAGAVTGYQTFDSALDTGDTTYYTIADQSGVNWEVGIGTFTSPSTLARTTILSSSNGGSVVTFTSGTKDVFISLPASKTVQSFSAGSTGLTPSTASFGAVALAGTLVATNGGTGQSSYTIGDLLYASGSTALSKLADIATGNALISGGVATAPSWGKIGLTTHISGTLGVANGGTGTATAFTAGSVVFAGASGVYAQDNASLFFDDTNNRLGIGTVSPDASLTVNTIASFGAGAAALPSIAAKGDLDTGVWFPAANTIAASTGGVERLRIDTSGNVGIGTSSPAARMDVRGSIYAANTASAYVALNHDGTNGSITNNTGKMLFYANGANDIVYHTNNSERLCIDSSGNIYPKTAPSSSWGLAGYGYSAPISLANDATYDFAVGSGLIMIISAGNTIAGSIIFAAVGGTTIISDPGGVFSNTVNTASKFNVYYESSVGKYRLQNKRGAAENIIYIATLAARPAA
jgi:hypothetical protein